jgi:hypothetical protein
MRIAKQGLIGTVFILLYLVNPALAQENPKLLGLWKLVAFHTEDVQTKARNNVYGDQPMGYIRIWDDGRFDAWAAESNRKFSHRAIFYSGKHRVDGDKLTIHVDQVLHEGWEGAQPFDVTWNEGRTANEQVRYFHLESRSLDRDVLRVETPPIANPNGSRNTIIGRLVWERSSEWE